MNCEGPADGVNGNYASNYAAGVVGHNPALLSARRDEATGRFGLYHLKPNEIHASGS